jgi:hypothetical protein
MEERATDIYAIAARVKNLARSYDGTLTPLGDALCNSFATMFKDFYDFAERLEEPDKTRLLDLIESKESIPSKIISLNRKKK